MEEKNKDNQKEVKKQVKKISYEELETVAKQFAAQLDAAVKENNQLRLTVQKLQLGNMYTELEFKFKVLQNAEMFSSEFVELCVKSIEDIMTPEAEETIEEEEDKDE